MKWDPDLYTQKHSFVAEYGKQLLGLLAGNDIGTVLDLGCGDGVLTQVLHAMGKSVLGVDSSPDMVAKAKARYPQIDFQVVDACELPWENCFDAVFSNAVFHWIADQERLLAGVYRVLKPGGRLVCEFGGDRNIAAICGAFSAAVGRLGNTYISPFFFPTAERYAGLLEGAGFVVESVCEYDRPTPLADGEAGLRNFLRQFFVRDLEKLSSDGQVAVMQDIEEALRGELWDGRQWIADYRRLMAVAVKP